MCVGQTCDHTISTNFNTTPLDVFFLGYTNKHKGFKCLNAFKGRIYISRDVIFDESIFPFASLHLTAGARYHFEVLLIPSTQPGDTVITNVTNVPTLYVLPSLESVQLQHESVVGPVPQFPNLAVPVPPAPSVPRQPIIGAHDEGGGGVPPSDPTPHIDATAGPTPAVHGTRALSPLQHTTIAPLSYLLQVQRPTLIVMPMPQLSHLLHPTRLDLLWRRLQ